MINYPNGKPFKLNPTKVGSNQSEASSNIKYGGRGMTLEKDIEQSNTFYLKSGIAVIHKKPTPVQIVNVHYPKRSKAVINEAYFRTPSTTDYNGVYNGYYIDFEAKETKNKTSFPLNNIHAHQVEHMKNTYHQKGIVFLDGTVCKPARLEILSASPSLSQASITISEGKFHQVKKMFLSVGVKVTSLKRTHFGPWSLDENLQAGDYRPLNSKELTSIRDFLRKSG